MRWKDVFRGNSDAPTEEEFIGHLTHTEANAMFRWSDQANGLAYTYDLSINQVQVIPSKEPFSQRIEEANTWLWKFLPPELLDAPTDWSTLWFEAANRNDTARMEFILEQGFDVNTVGEYGQMALDYAVVPYGGSFEMVTMLVNAGVKLDTAEQLIQKAAETATSANEAGEQKRIAEYFRMRTAH